MAAKASPRSHDLTGFTTLASLRVPRTTRTLGRMIAISIPLLLVLLFAVKWVQTAPGRGDVIALNPEDRVQQVTALVPGRVERWFVVDGQQVKKGDPIARIIDNDPDLLIRLAAEREQVVAQISAAEQAMATARLDVNRSSQLYAEGLAASLRAGIAAVPEDAPGIIVSLGDMPNVTAPVLDRLAQAFTDAPEALAVAPTLLGQRGNPVLLSRALFPAVAALTGDQGARRLLEEAGEAVIEVPLDDPAIALDVDTPEALRAVGG